MPMKLSNVALLLVVVTICAVFSLRIFQGLDEMMGDQYWVIDTTQGEHGWYAMGLLPYVQKLPKDLVKAANTNPAAPPKYLIYAQNGDFAGNSVYGLSLIHI
jgi:hypothetical protein